MKKRGLNVNNLSLRVISDNKNIFQVVMRVEVEDYAFFLIAGLFPWQWFRNSVNASALVFLGNASIVNYHRKGRW